MTSFVDADKRLIDIEANGDQREQHSPGRKMGASARGGQNDAKNGKNWLSGCTQIDSLQTVCACQETSNIHGILSLQ